jgi:hypothetical protein
MCCARLSSCLSFQLLSNSSRYNELFECIKNANSGKFTAADSGNVSLGDYLLDQNDVDIGAIKTKHWDPERPRPSFKFGAGLEKLFKGFDDTLISLAQHCTFLLLFICPASTRLI